jgi:hypothetical protein
MFLIIFTKNELIMNTSKMPEDLTGRIQIRILSLWIRPKEKIALKF